MYYLFSLSNVALEDRKPLKQTLENYKLSFDFSAALHYACYYNFISVTPFDVKKFSKCVLRLGITPPVIIPKV